MATDAKIREGCRVLSRSGWDYYSASTAYVLNDTGMVSVLAAITQVDGSDAADYCKSKLQ